MLRLQTYLKMMFIDSKHPFGRSKLRPYISIIEFGYGIVFGYALNWIVESCGVLSVLEMV